MSDEEPRVTLRFIEKGELSFCRAKLIFEQGQPFAVADEGALGPLPQSAKIPLEALHLISDSGVWAAGGGGGVWAARWRWLPRFYRAELGR